VILGCARLEAFADGFVGFQEDLNDILPDFDFSVWTAGLSPE
jgi:hypothetical protein